MSMGSSVPRLHLREDDVVRLVLEFIGSRQFHISQVCVKFWKLCDTEFNFSVFFVFLSWVWNARRGWLMASTPTTSFFCANSSSTASGMTSQNSSSRWKVWRRLKPVPSTTWYSVKNTSSCFASSRKQVSLQMSMPLWKKWWKYWAIWRNFAHREKFTITSVSFWPCPNWSITPTTTIGIHPAPGFVASTTYSRWSKSFYPTRNRQRIAMPCRRLVMIDWSICLSKVSIYLIRKFVKQLAAKSTFHPRGYSASRFSSQTEEERERNTMESASLKFTDDILFNCSRPARSDWVNVIYRSLNRLRDGAFVFFFDQPRGQHNFWAFFSHKRRAFPHCWEGRDM